MCGGVFTWRRLVSAVPESSAGSPSWPSLPRVDGVSLPVLYAGPPGSFSFARGASGAAGTQRQSQRLTKYSEGKLINIQENSLISLPQPQSP